MPLEQFSGFGHTVRVAERLEDQRRSRLLSSITYALWYKDVKRRPAFKKYLQKLDLWDDRDALFMHPLDDRERNRAGVAARQKRGPKTIETIEKALESDKNNGWGDDLSVADLMEYKRRKDGTTRHEKSDVPETVYLLDERTPDLPRTTDPDPNRSRDGSASTRNPVGRDPVD